MTRRYFQLVVLLALVFTPVCICPNPGRKSRKRNPSKITHKRKTQSFVYTAIAIRTCNFDMPVMRANNQLSILLAPRLTKQTLNLFLDSGPGKLENVLNAARDAWPDRISGDSSNKDVLSAAKVMMLIGKQRDGDGHAFIITNSKVIAVINSSSTSHIHSPKKESVFIKIIATQNRVDELEQLMECGYDDRPTAPKTEAAAEAAAQTATKPDKQPRTRANRDDEL